jgi:hypothetical protein
MRSPGHPARRHETAKIYAIYPRRLLEDVPVSPMIMYLNRYEYDMLMMMSEEDSERKIQALLVSYCVIRKTILSLVGEGKWCGYPRRLAKKRRFGSFVERQKQGGDRGGGGGSCCHGRGESFFLVNSNSLVVLDRLTRLTDVIIGHAVFGVDSE